LARLNCVRLFSSKRNNYVLLQTRKMLFLTIMYGFVFSELVKMSRRRLCICVWKRRKEENFKHTLRCFFHEIKQLKRNPYVLLMKKCENELHTYLLNPFKRHL